MTKRGILCLIVFALTLLAALATGFSEIFLTAFLFGMVLTFALVSTAAGVFALRAAHSASTASIVRGEKVHVEMKFEGTVPLPTVVRIVLRLPDGRIHTCGDMLFGSKHALTYDDIQCPHRGYFKVGITKVTCGDIFGLFSLPLRRINMPSQMETVLIYPILYELPGSPQPPMPSMDYSENNPITADQGDSFSDTRLYRDGDPLKRIHWKLTVRTRELHTRQYEMSLDQMVIIILDTSAKAGEPLSSVMGYADMAAECSAALALYYVNAGHAVKIIPTGDIHKSVLIRSLEEFDDAYTLLASVPFESATPLLKVLIDYTSDMSSISSFHVIAHEPSQDIMDTLSGLPTRRRKVSVIFPFVGGGASGKSAESSISPEGLHIIPITQPRDIIERLGENT